MQLVSTDEYCHIFIHPYYWNTTLAVSLCSKHFFIFQLFGEQFQTSDPNTKNSYSPNLLPDYLLSYLHVFFSNDLLFLINALILPNLYFHLNWSLSLATFPDLWLQTWPLQNLPEIPSSMPSCLVFCCCCFVVFSLEVILFSIFETSHYFLRRSYSQPALLSCHLHVTFGLLIFRH